MHLLQSFRDLFTAAKESGITIDDAPTAQTADEALASLMPPDPRVADMQQQLAAYQAEVAAMKAAAVQKDADAFADQQIAAHRAFPAERSAIAALYVAAATNGGLDQVRSAYASRPAHRLTGEHIKDAQLFVLSQDASKDTSEQDAEARRKALLSMTPMGQDALKARGSH